MEQDLDEGMLVKVMTDEQMELLRKQIAIYATICQQLVELHKSLTSHQDLTGNIYTDGGYKFSGRQRWTPTPLQLQILEQLFHQGNGTPSKQKIKEITCELSQHGHISETNVYNWFQNRRARSKRKQQVSATNNGESEVESPKPQQNLADFQTPNVTSVDQRAKKVDLICPSDAALNPSENAGQMSYYGTMLANPTAGTSHNATMDQLIGKIEVPGSYQSYMQGDEYKMTS